MTELVRPLDAMPLRVKAFARLWAMRAMAKYPNWGDGGVCIDEWRQVGDYDLNLWIEDSRLRVSAYALFKDNEDLTTDHSDWVTIVDREG